MRDYSVAVCGGGTGGHIFPALAVAEQLRKIRPDLPIYYFGRANDMEAGIVERFQLPFHGLMVQGFSRSLSVRNLAAVWQAGTGFLQVRSCLKRLKVRAVLGTGGYVCGPVVSAAFSLGIPGIIHESNLVPGLTNRILAGLVNRIAVCHSQTMEYFPEKKVRVMGFPLREGLNQVSRAEGCARFGLDPEKRVVFVFPGSLAAHRINRAVAEMLPQLEQATPDLQLLWMTGPQDLPMAEQSAQGVKIKVIVQAFIHAVAEAYAAADIVVARAGAGTIAELSATGKPALLVPYPYATDDHQTHNAAVLQKYGSAEVMPDQAVTGPELLSRMNKMLSRLSYMQECGAVLKADYPKTAAQDLAAMMIELAEKKR